MGKIEGCVLELHEGQDIIEQQEVELLVEVLALVISEVIGHRSNCDMCWNTSAFYDQETYCEE